MGDEKDVYGCRPAALVLGMGSIGCDECPFPFCVEAEARIVKVELREHMARIMRKLGGSLEDTAKAMGVTTRSVCRYNAVHETTGCAQCDLVRSLDVMCRSDTHTVVYSRGQYITILNKHRRATARELRLVQDFIEYVFPTSIVERSTSGHDYWVLNKVELEEVRNFERMCNALDRYTLMESGAKAEESKVRREYPTAKKIEESSERRYQWPLQ